MPSSSSSSSSSDEEKKTPGVYGNEKGGAKFDDKNNPGIVSIAINAGTLVDAIAVKYVGGKETYHGGQGGGKSELTLGEGEYIDEIKVAASDKKGVCCLTFKTNKGNVLGPCGGGGGMFGKAKEELVHAPEGRKLVGIKGRAGDRLDAIGFRWGRV